MGSDKTSSNSNHRKWLLISLPFFLRILLAISTKTFFLPDEYFQSLEVAHHLVFGYGHITWEWVAAAPIRSFMHPAIFVPVYKLLQMTGLDQGEALIYGPKILQGCFAAMADHWTYILASQVLGPSYASTALFLSFLSFYNTLALSRTLSNSLETSLTVIALAHWPLASINIIWGKLRISLFVAAFACMIRPTNAIIWVILGIDLLRTRLKNRSEFGRIFLTAIAVVIIAAGSVFVVDTAYYRRPTFTSLNFIITNLSSVSLFYGENPWHFYFIQALPILCTTSLPFALHGFYTSIKGSAGEQAQKLAIVVAITIIIYSFAGHKEWRFIHPLLPILLVFASKSLVDAYHHTKDNTARAPHKVFRLPITTRNACILLASVPLSVYVIFFHGRGQIAAIDYLRHLPPSNISSVGFLMPCHSTPWQSHLHREDLEGHAWALGCEPPLLYQDISEYQDQTRVFYNSPLRYIRLHFPNHVDPMFPRSALPSSPPGQSNYTEGDWSHTWPSHLVMFHALLEITDEPVELFLRQLGYEVVWISGWNGWEGDEKRRGQVLIWEWNDGAK